MPSPILARADALMQRRRQSSGEADEVPVLTDAIDVATIESNEDDIPVLHDIETPAPPTEPEPLLLREDEPSPPAPVFDAAMRDFLAHELARRVQQRIIAELPRLIDSTVRDFLAEQEMIAAQRQDD